MYKTYVAVLYKETKCENNREIARKILTKRSYYGIIQLRNANHILNMMANAGKEKAMDEMNETEEMDDFALTVFLKMILEILNGCKDLDEAKGKIKALLNR